MLFDHQEDWYVVSLLRLDLFGGPANLVPKRRADGVVLTSGHGILEVADQICGDARVGRRSVMNAVMRFLSVQTEVDPRKLEDPRSTMAANSAAVLFATCARVHEAHTGQCKGRPGDKGFQSLVSACYGSGSS